MVKGEGEATLSEVSGSLIKDSEFDSNDNLMENEKCNTGSGKQKLCL